MSGTAIVKHRPAHSLDTIATLCEGCDGYWPCELAGHEGGYGYSVVTEDDFWWCAIECPHPRHSGSPGDGT